MIRLIGAVLVACASVASAACGDAPAAHADAHADVHAAHATGRDTTPDADPATDSGVAATQRFETLCASDSMAVRVSRQLAADSIHAVVAARADSVRLADSLRAADSTAAVVAARDSAAGRTRRTHRTTRTHPRVHAAAASADPEAAGWRGAVARRASGQPPLPGSLFPGCRVVAYYGNPLSKRMGILGALPPDSMLAHLARQASAYARADSTRHVLPALELIATVAQANPGRDGMYRARMPDTLIAKVARWADAHDYLLILDIQTGRSSVRRELAPLLPYLARPNVHLALDPEFAMLPGKVPGHVIGTLDASDVNIAIDTLAALVREHHLPPKMLIVHRFTRPMLTNHEHIRLDPRVQVVIDMDGFGSPWLKRNSYRAYVHRWPVQFAGFKLFYKNDRPLLSPADVLKLVPVPLFIMYQ